MRHRGRLLVSCAVWLMVEAPAFAHHSAAAFDLQREVTLKGTVTSYQFKNPHIYISLKVQKEDGSTAITEVEAAPPAVLIPLGFRKDSIRIGEQVTLTGNPSRNRGDSLLVGKELYKSDGTYMPLSLVSRSIYQGKDGVATSIAGTWLPARRDFATYLTGVRGWPFTEQG
ncbi:MAG TPA: DUF6152 family protein, partial [Anaerolineales bacterium]|nr:DUF6152 family protein [Anaerolineales bacterium]